VVVASKPPRALHHGALWGPFWGSIGGTYGVRERDHVKVGSLPSACELLRS